MNEFAECVEMVVDALSADKSEEVDQAMFIDVAGLVHEGMREIRKAVAMRDVSTEKWKLCDGEIIIIEYAVF